MHRKTDSEIEQWVLRELSVSEKERSPEICVFARDGVVSLRGSAQSHQDKLAVEEAARRATGVVVVVNEMRVKPCTALIEKVSPSVPLTEVRDHVPSNFRARFSGRQKEHNLAQS